MIGGFYCAVGGPGAVLVPCLSKTSWIFHPLQLPQHARVSDVSLVSYLFKVFVRKESLVHCMRILS